MKTPAHTANGRSPLLYSNHRDPSRPGHSLSCTLFMLFTASLLFKTAPSFTIPTKRSIFPERGRSWATEPAELRRPFTPARPRRGTRPPGPRVRRSSLASGPVTAAGAASEAPRQSPGGARLPCHRSPADWAPLPRSGWPDAAGTASFIPLTSPVGLLGGRHHGHVCLGRPPLTARLSTTDDPYSCRII